MRALLIPITRNGRKLYKMVRLPDGKIEIPDEVTEALARCYLPRIIEFYEDENNMKAYEQWKKEKDKKGE